MIHPVMTQTNLSHHQRGVTLVVGLVMLLLFTLMVSSAFILSGTNLKSVGNMQGHDEAMAAANQAINTVISSSFTTAPVAQTLSVDINNDGTNDYSVAIATPTCLSAKSGGAGAASSVSLGVLVNGMWNTVWNLDATVTDVANSGATVRVRSGVRVLLTQVQCDAVCPPAVGGVCS